MSRNILITILLACIAIPGHAQTGTGTPSFGVSIPINAYESVDAGTLNLLFQAKVRSKLGSIPLSFALSTNSQLYVNSNDQYATTSASPVHLAQGYWPGLISYNVIQQTCQGTNYNVDQFTGIYDGNGALNVNIKPRFYFFRRVWSTYPSCGT